MKHLKYVILLSVFSISISCRKSFLEVTDSSNINRQTYVKDLPSLQEFMNGTYVMLSSLYEIHSNTAYPEQIADNLKSSSYLSLHYNWSQVVDPDHATNSSSMNLAWMDLYKIIRNCNFVIEEVDKYSSENLGKSNSIKGQAYAIRALIHFRLVNIFAQHYHFTTTASHLGVPYITTSDITQAYSRQTVAEVYDYMIADLQSAISLMPDTIADCRFMNGPAAKALLARIYLFKEDYENAKKLSSELIAKYPLLTITGGYPANLFKNIPSTQTEVLFQIIPVAQSGAISEFLGIATGLYGYYQPTTDIVNILQETPDDIRSQWVTSVSAAQWTVNKFTPGVAGGLGYHPETDYYPPIIRSSELLLTAAEACAKTNDETNARQYLDAIRKRANPSVQDVLATGTSLLDSIYKERRKELCFEGLRMWDIQRWKKSLQRTDVIPGYQTTLTYPNEKAIAPIPGQDVKLMHLQQNPGY